MKTKTDRTGWDFLTVGLAAWVGLCCAVSCSSSDQVPAGGRVEHPDPAPAPPPITTSIAPSPAPTPETPAPSEVEEQRPKTLAEDAPSRPWSKTYRSAVARRTTSAAMASATEAAAPQSGPIQRNTDSRVKGTTATFPVLTGASGPVCRMRSVHGRATCRNAFLTHLSPAVASAWSTFPPSRRRSLDETPGPCGPGLLPACCPSRAAVEVREGPGPKAS
jgi:hypothetical protein